MLADDHRVFVDALAVQLEAEADVVVVGRAHDLRTTEELARKLMPDVLLSEVEFEDGDGIELAARLQTEIPELGIVMLTAHDDTATAVAAVKAGVAGFLCKDASLHEVVFAITSAARHEAWIQSRLLRNVLKTLVHGDSAVSPEQEKLARLTEREFEVLCYMVQGLDRTAIARELYLSKNTVRTHIRNLLAKLEKHSSVEAVSFGLRAGLGTDAPGPRTYRRTTRTATSPTGEMRPEGATPGS